MPRLTQELSKKLLQYLHDDIDEFLKASRKDKPKIKESVEIWIKIIESGILADIKRSLEAAELDTTTIPYDRFVARLSGIAEDAEKKGKNVFFIPDDEELLKFCSNLKSTVEQCNKRKVEFVADLEKQEKAEQEKKPKNDEDDQITKRLEELEKATEETKRRASEAQETASKAQQQASKMQQELESARKELEDQRQQVVLRDDQLKQVTQVIKVINLGDLPTQTAVQLTQLLKTLNIKSREDQIEDAPSKDNNNNNNTDHGIIEEISSNSDQSKYFFDYPNQKSHKEEFNSWKQENPILYERVKLLGTISKARYVAICDLVFLKDANQPSLQTTNVLYASANGDLNKKIDEVIWQLLSVDHWNKSWSFSFEQLITPLLNEIEGKADFKLLYECLTKMKNFDTMYSDTLPDVYDDPRQTLATIFQNGFFVPKNRDLKEQFSNAMGTQQEVKPPLVTSYQK